LEFGPWDLGLGAWNLGFETWDLNRLKINQVYQITSRTYTPFPGNHSAEHIILQERQHEPNALRRELFL
jgi:hypothetical protein